MTELYLYQTVHLREGSPRLVAGHAALLNEAAQVLFGCTYTPDPQRLAERIAAAADAEGYPHRVSGFVRVEVSETGEERLRPAGVSLYDGYALRSLTPEARTVVYDTPFTEAPTSVREQTSRLACRTVRAAGAGIAVRCDAGGFCLAAGEAPLFAVRGHTVLTAPASAEVLRSGPASPASGQVFPSIERGLVLHAVRRAGLTLREEPFSRKDLQRFDELFYADHRGITSLSRCDGLPFMSLIAERVAEAMEGLFSQR